MYHQKFKGFQLSVAKDRVLWTRTYNLQETTIMATNTWENKKQ